MKALLCSVLLFAVPTAWGQQTQIETLARSVAERAAGRPSELLYVQTSKSIYETGEDLWFKAYQLHAQSLSLSDSSKTLYLRVVDTRDSVVWREKYPIDHGIAAGHIYVGADWPVGEYLIEAYSRQSFYDDSLSLPSVRKIRVVERIADPVPVPEKSAPRVRFSAYAEGGDLVAGVEGRVAFEAMDADGRPFEVQGVLTEDGKPILPFQTTDRGMGTIVFTPEVNKEYVLACADGTADTLSVLGRGIAMRLTDRTDDYLEFTVSQPAGGVRQELFLVAQLRGTVCCVAKGVLGSSLLLRLPLAEFPYSGIAEVTLYDAALRPVAERLVSVRSKERLYVSVRPSQEFYATRQKAKIDIYTTNAAGAPVQAHLGVSVFDGAYDDPSLAQNIASHCLLTAQIRGAIFDPAYYFDPKNKEADRALDLLLLTRGWRRYVWRQTEPTVGTAFLGDGLDGVLSFATRRKRSSAPTAPPVQAIHLSGAKGGSVFAWVDSLGRFSVDVPTMKQLRAGALYFRPLTPDEGPKPTLSFNDSFDALEFARARIARFVPVGDTAGKRVAALADPIRSDDGSTLIEGIVVSAKGRLINRDKVLGRLDSLMQAQVGPYECQHGNLENYLPGYTHHHDPAYCPNAEPVTERRPPVIGKKYTLLKAEYFPCNARGGWCFKVLDRKTITYTGIPYTEEELLAMNGMWKTKGYYGEREFYQANQADAQLSTPDPRNTLLWNPMVVTNEKGHAEVEFYCSDLNTGFVVSAEGTDGAGLVGAGRGEFRVLKKGPQ